MKPSHSRPLAIDLFTGLHGWAEGLIDAGFYVIGVDLVDMSAEVGEPKPDHFDLIIQDVRTLHGSQFRHAELIVSSSPCTEYSYMAMPWSRAKAKAAAIRADETGEALRKLNELFDAQFRIQREASEAAGRHIPMVVENVKGAQPWVGRARGNFGSYYLWGDVPALMPSPVDARKVPGFRFDGSGRSFQSESVARHVEGRKNDGGSWFNIGSPGQVETGKNPVHAHVAEGRKGAGAGAEWFDKNLCVLSSKSSARKAASAKIARIPLALSRYVGLVYRPAQADAA